MDGHRSDAVKGWYKLVRFPCPRCGQRLAVERGQVTRNEQVVCNHCNTDLVLMTKGGSVVSVSPDRNTGEQATVVEIRA